jgi:4-aminobutyrate aminotransferase
VIITFRGGFHGRTAQTMALTTAKNVYRAAFEPLPGSVYATAYPYCYRAAGGQHSPDACTCDWEAHLELTFEQIVYPEQVAAFLVEPVIGEGGYIVPPVTFLPRLREIASRHGILLIADEVQTGFGRTGKLFAVEHTGVTPDVLVMAKGIASGLPLSGLITQRSLLERLPTGSQGGTFGGNVVACAAANATLDVIEEEGLVANAAERGRQLLEGLRALQPRYRSIGDVRGLGLMVAMEFVKPGEGDGRVANGALAKHVMAEALDRRLMLLSAGTWGQVVRIIAPLVTTAEEVDLALGILDESVAAAGA